MALPWVFANLAAGNQPASRLDDNFNALGAISTIPCTAAGTNAYTLTQVASTPSVSAYNQLQAFRAVIPATSTGAVTAGLASPGLLPCYKPGAGGPTAAGSGDVVIGEVYDFVYDVALNSGGGGFHLYNVIPASSGSVVIQTVNVETGAVATGTTVIPFDDTIPQITEGDQYMSLAITPTNATHKLIIEAVVNLSSSATQNLIAALFQDATANALIAGVVHENAVGGIHQVILKHYMTAGTTSATTFKVRAGDSNAGTTTFNGVSGGRIFGGVLLSSITITETT